jgi:hypothetical protein
MDVDAPENTANQSTAAAGAGGGGGSSSSGWHLGLPLDGSVELTEDMLLDKLPVFHSMSSLDCSLCQQQLQAAASGHQEVKAAADAQRAALKRLMQGCVQEVLEPGVQYYLVPK